MRKPFAIAALTLALTTTMTAAAAVKPPAPPKPAICKRIPNPNCQTQPAANPAGVYATVTATTLELHATHLTPGQTLYYIYQVWGTGNPYPYWRGGSGVVRNDGTITVSEDTADLHAWAEPYDLYEVTMWYGNPDSYWTTPATNLDGVTLKTTVEFDD